MELLYYYSIRRLRYYSRIKYISQGEGEEIATQFVQRWNMRNDDRCRALIVIIIVAAVEFFHE